MDLASLVIPAIGLTAIIGPLVVRHLWRKDQAARAQALLDIVDGDLPYVDVQSGVRSVSRRSPGDDLNERDRHGETWFRATLGEAATVKLAEPGETHAPHVLEDPQQPKVLAVWGSPALAERARSSQALVRHVLVGTGRRSVVDGTVEVVVHGELDAMGRAAIVSDVSDLVRALNGTPS